MRGIFGIAVIALGADLILNHPKNHSSDVILRGKNAVFQLILHTLGT
jgi:hypothetical protein